jgi:RNA-binding protein
MTPLHGFQRKYLRGLAHSMRPLVTVGRAGLTDEFRRELARILDEHELVKVAMHKPEDKKALAAELAVAADAVLAGLIGHTAVLYRPHPEKPRIKVPTRSPAEPEPSEE